MQNEKFIGFQQTLGAKIVSPSNGEELCIDLPLKYPIRIKSAKFPDPDRHFLLCLRDGLCCPQTSVFRPDADPGTWNVEAYFTTEGQHTLYLVTAVDLGVSLVTYYRKVGERNSVRRKRVEAIAKRVDGGLRKELLEVITEGTWRGIPMTVLPKGLRSEASVAVTIKDKLLS